MKKLIIFLALVAPALVYGQVKPPEIEQSKLEAFSAKAGSLIEKSYDDAGTFKGIAVQTYKMTDLLTNLRLTGLRFEKVNVSTFSTEIKTAALDLDEVEDLITSINILKTKVFLTKPSPNTEVIYQSRGGFSAGAYYFEGKWTPFVNLQKNDRKSAVFITPAELDAFLALVQKAYTVIH